MERSRGHGREALALLQPLHAHPHVGDVRGRGLMLGRSRSSRTRRRGSRSRAPRSRPRRSAREGLRGRPRDLPGGGCADGTNGDSIMISPPFVITRGRDPGARRDPGPRPDGAADSEGRRLKETPMAKNYPHFVTPLPGPKAKAIIERDERVMAQNYSKDYPLVAARGERRHGRGRGRQPLPRLRGRHRRRRRRATRIPRWSRPSRRRPTSFIHMCYTDFYYDNLIELGERLAKRGAGAGPVARVLRQQRRRGGRGRDQARARRRRAARRSSPSTAPSTAAPTAP